MKSLLFALLACASLAFSQMTGKFSNTTIIQNNPGGVTYIASMPIGKGIQGQVVGASIVNGIGVNFDINFFQFPNASEGPFRKSSHHTFLHRASPTSTSTPGVQLTWCRPK
jgi:hypothetical protein